MFQEGNYDIPEFPIPVNGMNQFISPDSLPSNFCYFLENIIPEPIGSGRVRYGDYLTHSFNNPEINIFRSFPFTSSANIRQSLLYVSYYSQDLTVNTINITDASHFSFNSTNNASYFKDTKIKIVYTFNTIPYTLYADIKTVSVAVNTVSIVLINNFLPDPLTGALVITEIWAQFGAIYYYNNDTDTMSASLKTGLSIACVPRSVYFQQVMMIFNGVDNVMQWDGTNLTDVAEFIVELGANTFIRINNTHFSFISTALFDATKYFVGNSIKITVSGTPTILTISNVLIVGNLVTITTNENLPAFVANQVVLYYQDKPPTFSYMYAAKDRLWALGPGAVGLNYRTQNERLRVYYSYRPNPTSGHGFFNENTKTVPSIDMSDKHEIQDNFEAITQLNGLMAFVGRKKTQVWIGYTPGQNGDFSWNSNLSAGIFHGDLLIEFPNDCYFVSNSGIQSFSTLNIAKQFSANSEEAVDTIVKRFISDASFSDLEYRKCASFKYDKGTMAGFKISNNKILTSLFATRLYSWFYLSGDFSLANCFMDFGSQFYLFIGDKIFRYADGNDGSPKTYADQGGTGLIQFVWVPGLVRFKGKKGFASKRYELTLNYSSSFILNSINTIQVSIFGEEPNSFSLNDKCEFQYKGDLIGEEPLTNNALSDDPGFRLRSEYEVINKRLKFASSSFWLSVSGYVVNGPITFKRIRLFGVGERHG